jgi:hypothetical protein
MAENDTLRQQLDEASALRVKADYQIRLQELKERYGRTISVLEDGAHEIHRFNCFAYAFGVSNEPLYRQLADKWQSSSLIDSEFVFKMIMRGDLAKSPEDIARPGSLVLYFAGQQLCHAGIVEDTMARAAEGDPGSRKRPVAITGYQSSHQPSVDAEVGARSGACAFDCPNARSQRR